MRDSAGFFELLDRHFSPIRTLTEEEKGRLLAHYEMLARWNKALSLTTIHRLEDVVVRHYCESLFLGNRLETGHPDSVLDVGSGAGFPGVPIAVLLPHCKVTMAESHRRKAVFLREATRDYANVRVVAQRGESLPGEFDWVVSRAVRWEEVLALATRCLGLLLGQEDALAASQDKRFRWEPLVRLPWGERRMLLVGRHCST